jgi:Zn-dependent M28 family amino/carboxypeptidase
LIFVATAHSQSAADRDLVTGIRQVEDGYLEDGVATLESLARRLTNEPGRRRDLAQVYLHLGIAYAQLNTERSARASFREGLKLNPELKLDSDRWPPKVLRLFAIVKAEGAPPSSSPEQQSALAPPVVAAREPLARSAVTISPAEKAAAAQSLTAELMRSHVAFLADDRLEGRGPGSQGDKDAQRYIATRMEALGLEPAAPGGGWYQPFDLVGVTTRNPDTLRIAKGPEAVELRSRDEYIATSGVQVPEVKVEDAELVFVGYGIVAPEYGWDDFKGADLKGKVLLVMNNDPEDDPALFAGKTRLYYGRWRYKYEQAARLGAAGVLIIHTEPSAGYKWQVVQTSWSGEQFSLPHESEPQLPLQAWTTEDGARKIARLAGQDLDALRQAALKKGFRPVPLGVTLSVTLQNTVQKTQTANVIGRLPGRDPVLSKEAVLYTAHHDHLGKKDGPAGTDTIYNGALDNASGVGAMLAIAKAFAVLEPAPRRSVIFAAVAAEEQGLLGSQYLAAHPPVPAGRLAANINIDGASIWGRTSDLTMIGFGKSDLDAWVTGLAALQGRTVVPDQFPDKGFFYRSDQFNLAKIGVPAAYFHGGTKVIGKPEAWGKEQREKFEATDYHQPSDELRDTWDWSGVVQDAELLFHLGVKVANATPLPAWKPGDEFEAARKKALSAAR